MTAILVFALTLLFAVLLSELAHRSILSSAVIFLVVGFFLGNGMLHLLTVSPGNPVFGHLADLALFTVLFTDGMRVGIKDLACAWQLPGRALLLGLPLTLLGTAALAHYVAGTGWMEGLLLGAVLSPTDPVFAAAIVGRQEIPQRLRQLLNVESGLNDGLALPLVVGLLALLQSQEFHFWPLAGELLLGVGIGVALPWLAVRIEKCQLFSIATAQEPLFAFSIGLLVYAATSMAHANKYLGAFAAGVTISTVRPELRDEFRQFGELLVELLKLAAVMVFGALISPRFLAEISPAGYLFALATLILVRPLALGVALIGTKITWPEQIAASWFGPKGFASVVYGLLVLQSGVENTEHLFHLIALVVVASILAHSSTDVVVSRWFGNLKPKEQG